VISIIKKAPPPPAPSIIYLIVVILRFTPEMLLSELPAVTMIIDLTNTTKYYHPQVDILSN